MSRAAMSRAAMSRARAALLPLTVVAVVSACLAPAALARPTRSAAPTRAVGVTLDSGPGGEARAFHLFSAAGANAIEAPQPWSTLEPAPGRFQLGDVGAIVQGVRATPATRVMVIPAVIETTQRSVPRDLRRGRWDSRAMIDRYRTLIRRLAPHLSRQVTEISIANEADVYLSEKPGELPAFVRFARAEIAELHRRAPWARVGVTVTYDGLISAPSGVARRLAALGDATIITYYPLVDGYRMRSPRAPLRDIPRMRRLAHGRPLVVQEAGYSSSARLHGSRSAQAAFVRNVFTAWDRAPRAIPFLSFYTLFDPPAGACAGRSGAVTFFCSLGLRDRRGRPKPAWTAFRAGVRRVRDGRRRDH